VAVEFSRGNRRDGRGGGGGGGRGPGRGPGRSNPANAANTGDAAQSDTPASTDGGEQE
jgi:hypothetical protein